MAKAGMNFNSKLMVKKDKIVKKFWNKKQKKSDLDHLNGSILLQKIQNPQA